MNPNSSLSPTDRLKWLKNVKGLMLCRIIILSLLLTITFLFQVSEEKYFFIPLTNNFYYFIGLFYLVSIFYALFLRWVEDLRKFTFAQIIVDQIFITLLIYFTGGNESFFPLAYIFSIIGSSFIFYKRGAFFFASLSSFLYGLLLLLQLHQWINPFGQSLFYDASQIFYSVITYMAAFYIVAFLTATLSEELKTKKKELIQKQEDYAQLETFNRNVIQSLDSGLLTTDLNGRINFLNRTAEKILNRSREELRNISVADLFPEIQKMIERAQRKAPDSSLDYQRYETLFSDRDRRRTYLGFSISSLTAPDGSSVGHTLIFQDITKFKEMEDQMKRADRMAAAGVLAAGMAHEIRNPLASLSGSIQMLKSELVLDQSQQRLMDISLRESERLNALITDFLLFAHPPQTNKIPCEMWKVIEETIELFRHSPSFHEGIHIIRQPPPEIVRANLDPDQMKQVFWNLLINASQAISDGGEIGIQLLREKKFFQGRGFHLSPEEKELEWMRISISDSGNGIPPQAKEKIFEPFFTTKERGTGLGLSIVHRIVENHKGVIQVESEMGKGSTFTIYMPAEV